MTPTSPEGSDDLSALAWVHDELRRSLDAAHKALRRFVKDLEASGGSDVDALDPAVLRGARAQLHQGVGALELVGQTAAATVLRASEALVQRIVTRPRQLTPKLVDTVEHASFALLDYLARLLAGKPVSPLALFPQYRAVQEAGGADRVHPADLWTTDFEWREIAADASVAPRRADAATRVALEAQLLPLMRGGHPVKAAAQMSDLCAGLAAGASQPQQATLWHLAAAVFEAQSQGLLGFDVFSKRVASRLLAQFRIAERGEPEVSERLAHDLLFFCAQCAAPGGGRTLPRLAAVRRAYDLTGHAPVDYGASLLGRFDPALIAQARKRVAAAKESWSSVAGGELHRMGGLSEQFVLVGESLKRLFPVGDALAAELQQAVAQTQAAGSAPPAPLAMEVATSLLYVEAALEDAHFDHPEQADRVRRLAERLAAVRQGRAARPLEAWMEELYRRVSDRQTMGSVVQELRASLSEAERAIDQFFRAPDVPAVLIPVPNQLAAMRGVLSVLGMDHASAALLRMRDEVDALASGGGDAGGGAASPVFDRLAGNLGALGFLIDMLSVQPQLAKSLFAYDAQAGTLSPVMGRAPAEASAPDPDAPAPVEQRLIEQAQLLAFSAVRDDVPVADVTRDLERLSQQAQAVDQPALAAAVQKARTALEQAAGPDDEAAARGELSEALVDFVGTASEPVGLADDAPMRVTAPMQLDFAPSTQTAALAQDDEMREIFLEEAREVVGNAVDAARHLRQAPDDVTLLTALRRAFHTLKGSSRMVGLKDFGEAAWACEQLYNTRLADQSAAPPALLDFTDWSLGYLGAWVDAIGKRRSEGHDAATVAEAAGRLAESSAEPAALESAGAAFASSLTLDFGDFLAPASVTAQGPDAHRAAPADADPALAVPVDAGVGTSADAADAQPVADFAFEMPADPAASDIAIGAQAGADTAESAVEASAGGDAPFAFEAPAVDADHERPADPGVALELDPDAFDAFGTPDAAAPAAPPPADAPRGDDFAAPPPDPFDAYDPQPTEPMPWSERSDAAAPVDLELDLEAPATDAATHRDAAPDAATTRAGDADADADADEPSGAGPAQAADAADVDVDAVRAGDEHIKVVGPLRIGIPLFNIYLNEADELSRRLVTELAEWSMELHRPVGEAPIALAHSLAGSSATVGFTDLSQLARSLEHALTRSLAIGSGTPGEARLFVDAADEIRTLLHQFAAGFLKQPSPTLLERLAEHERDSARRLDEAAAADRAPFAGGASPDADVDAADAGGRGVTESAEPADPDARDAQHDDASAAPSHFGGLGVAELKTLGDVPVEAARRVDTDAAADDADDVLDAVDAVDAELFPIFDEEAEELLPQLTSRLRDWARSPGDLAQPAACMRTLHTLKGGARLAGAMRLGELAHRLESRIERLLAAPSVEADAVEALQSHGDVLAQTLDALRRSAAGETPAEPAVAEVAASERLAAAPDLEVLLDVAPAESGLMPLVSVDGSSRPAPLAPADADWRRDAPEAGSAALPPAAAAPIEDDFTLSFPPPETAAAGAAGVADRFDAPDAEPSAPPPEVDWARFGDAAATPQPARDRTPATQSAVRVRAPLLDRLVNQAGEVSITRSRIEGGVTQIKTSLADLTENLERLRAQLRDIEFHGEVQMTSRLEAAKAASQSFDPLEFDRFTRFQELTRMMAESVNDVATVQRSLQRSLEVTEDELAAQARMTRDLQDDLLRTRMIEFEGLSDRLYRVVRQAAKETGKSVRLDIVGGSIEVDRGVLDRMTGSFEHLLRNCVSHGIEMPAQRTQAGKDATGTIIVALSHEGNEVGVEFRDDGAGLDLARIRAKGVALGLLDAGADASDAELANLIFAPGFSTADSVTELAGRGVGMDVVRAEVNAMGGRIETATAVGQGTSFKLILPLTTAVTQVVMLRCGETRVAVPSTLVEVVRRVPADEVDAAHVRGAYADGDRTLPFFWLGALLQLGALPSEAGTSRTRAVVVIRSAQQRIALHVDEVIGNHEVVVKNLGPQLARLPGLAGVTLLASGDVALIYNPVALATLYGDAARAATLAALRAASAPGAAVPQGAAEPEVPQAPLVMVVDDSLTVRRVTQRLLVREGYRVVLAKDGLDALEQLAEGVPQIVLSDIEMPRMDGFDLVRNMRSDARLRDLPVIMITSRIAQKHRDYAAELGVDHYLGKPYSEEDLLALIARYTRDRVAA